MPKRPLNNVACVLLGCLAGGIVVAVVEAASSAIYELPPDLDPSDAGAMRRYVAGLPMGAFLFVLAAHVLGALVGGAVCTLAARRRWPQGALIVGGLMTVAGAFNLATIPHPFWFVVIDLASFVPSACLGGRLVRRSKHEATESESAGTTEHRDNEARHDAD